jgi:hypothetical protein
MPVFAEFLLVAFLIYLWESSLWLPKRGLAARKRWFGTGWRVSSPGRWLATRELGIVPMLPLPPDSGLAPCGGVPLATDENGRVFHETTDGDFRETTATTWEPFTWQTPRLHIGPTSLRCQSPRAAEPLKKQRALGNPPPIAIRRLWKLALSPTRASRERRRWQLVAAPLRWYPPLLTIGFFLFLPTLYILRGPMPCLWLALWLWCLMIFISAHLWWLGKRAYPAARAELRMDALLALVVPFHAMRALELASVHAFATTHPAALLISTGDLKNPWLAKYIRTLLHPRPGNPGDAALSHTAAPILNAILKRHSSSLAAFDQPPSACDDPEAVTHCPRCHALFTPGPQNCPDCADLPLRPLPKIP